MKVDACIIGGGLSGLSAGMAWKESGATVCVVEAGNRPGGALRTEHRDGFLVEAGPNTLLLDDARLLRMIERLGIASRVVTASSQARKRYVVRDGQMLAAPDSLISLIRTPLFSTRGKLRLIQEPFVPRRDDVKDEESLASMVERRLGPEVLDQAVQPMVSGVYAGDPRRLSARYAFPSLFDLEKQHGSFLKGALHRLRHPSPHKIKRRLISFRDGMETLPKAMAEHLGPSLLTDTRVVEMEKAVGGWCLELSNGEKVESRMLISTVPAHRLDSLPWPGDLAVKLTSMGQMVYAPVTVVALGFTREAVEHPLDGFGVLIPEGEGVEVLGALFSSSLFPHRAPEGQVLVTCFLGGRLHPERAEGIPSELVARAVKALTPLLGIKGVPVFSHLESWPRAIPQMELGFESFKDVMHEVEERWEGLVIGGNYRSGISAPQCMRAGIELREKFGHDDGSG